MKCAHLKSLFTAHHDGELDRETRRIFAGHLESCPECRREWRRFQATLSLLHDLEPLEAPAGILAGVREKLDHPSPRSPWQRLLQLWQRIDLTVPLPTAAATLALAAVVAVVVKLAPLPGLPPGGLGGDHGPLLQSPASPLAGQPQLTLRQAHPPLGRDLPAAGSIPQVEAAFNQGATVERSPDWQPAGTPLAPDILITLASSRPESLAALHRLISRQQGWRTLFNGEQLLVHLPAEQLPRLRRLMAENVSSVAERRTLPGRNKAHLTVAIRYR